MGVGVGRQGSRSGRCCYWKHLWTVTTHPRAHNPSRMDTTALHLSPDIHTQHTPPTPGPQLGARS